MDDKQLPILCKAPATTQCKRTYKYKYKYKYRLHCKLRATSHRPLVEARNYTNFLRVT